MKVFHLVELEMTDPRGAAMRKQWAYSLTAGVIIAAILSISGYYYYAKYKTNQLLLAVAGNNSREIHRLSSPMLKSCPFRLEKGYAPLHIAVIFRRIQAVQSLVQSNWNINAVDNFGDTPLFYAVTNDNAEYTDYLLRTKSAFNHIISDQMAILTILLSNNADVNHQNKRGGTVLFFANDAKVLEALISHKAFVNAVDNDGRTAISYVQDAALANVFLIHNAKIDVADNKGYTPLTYAVQNNNLPLVELYLRYGGNVSEMHGKKFLMHIAARSFSYSCSCSRFTPRIAHLI